MGAEGHQKEQRDRFKAAVRRWMVMAIQLQLPDAPPFEELSNESKDEFESGVEQTTQGLIDIAPSASVIVRIIRGGLAPLRYNAAQRLFTGDSGAPYQNHAGLVLSARPPSE
jgi:hypothetical protein